MAKRFLPLLICAALALSTHACRPPLPAAQTQPALTPPASPTVPTRTPTGLPATPTWAADPVDLVSLDSLLAYLEDLTSIQPFSGWRNSASSGEAQALDYVQGKLGGLATLQGNGLELERQRFPVYLSTELWASSLTLQVVGKAVEVPAQGLRGSRLDRRLAAYFDTDGVLNDSDPDPVTASGAPLLVRDEDSLNNLSPAGLKGRILFLDYSLLDRYVNGQVAEHSSRLLEMVNQGLAGVVLVTEFSNQSRASHGTVLADSALFPYGEIPFRRVPVLFIRLEDLGAAGITAWEDLDRITSAGLTLDADGFSPGQSGNLIAHIPGADPSRAILLGAHIDSPNGPGAFDDGSGSAALLEIARVLNASQAKPPIDLYLAWFGGHEIGTYGSAYFVSTHQDLLDRTVAALIMDCLGHPLEGHASSITMDLTSYGRFGIERSPLADYLTASAAGRGIPLDRVVEYGLIADNSNFDAFNVPSLDLLYMNAVEIQSRGADYAHYSNHWHDPYESVSQAEEVGQAFVDMTRVLLSAVFEADPATCGCSAPVPAVLAQAEAGRTDLRVSPASGRRAVFVGSHTETTTVITALHRELGMALAWQGLDVDMVPYGQALTSSDLESAAIVVVPPTLDYPGAHDETWGAGELALLDEYVKGGGFLVVTNSAYNFSTTRPLDDQNEDKRALNALLEPMGIRFKYAVISTDTIALAAADHPLVQDAGYLSLYLNNAVPFSLENGTVLVESAGLPMVGLVDYGENGGQVLVVADVGLLQAGGAGRNLDFLKNIARYAVTR